MRQMMSSPSISSSSLMVSGGSSRMMLPNMPQVNTMTPAAWAAVASFSVSSASGSVVPDFTSSTAIMAPRPRTSPIRSSPACTRTSRSVTSRPICWARSISPSLSMVAMLASAAAQATGLPPNRAAQATAVRRVHDLGPAGHRRQRQSAGDTFGGADQVGLDALVLAGEHRSGPGKPGHHLVGDEHNVVLMAPIEQRRQEPLGRNDEAAFALDGLDDDGGQIFGADLLLEDADGARGGEFTVGGQLLVEQAVPIWVGHWRPVDLGRE